eukprot:Colp12_sorted_trinity150504_noHs@12518
MKAKLGIKKPGTQFKLVLHLSVTTLRAKVNTLAQQLQSGQKDPKAQLTADTEDHYINALKASFETEKLELNTTIHQLEERIKGKDLELQRLSREKNGAGKEKKKVGFFGKGGKDDAAKREEALKHMEEENHDLIEQINKFKDAGGPDISMIMKEFINLKLTLAEKQYEIEQANLHKFRALKKLNAERVKMAELAAKLTKYEAVALTK